MSEQTFRNIDDLEQDKADEFVETQNFASLIKPVLEDYNKVEILEPIFEVIKQQRGYK